MTLGGANPYTSYDVFIAADHHERLENFVSRSEDERKVFSRWIDAWWVAMTMGVHSGRRSPLPRESRKIIDGRIFDSDPWRITHLELLALAENGSDALERPGDVIRMASEYANAGFPDLLDQLIGQNEPTLHLMLQLKAIGEGEEAPTSPRLSAARGQIE